MHTWGCAREWTRLLQEANISCRRERRNIFSVDTFAPEGAKKVKDRLQCEQCCDKSVMTFWISEPAGGGEISW